MFFLQSMWRIQRIRSLLFVWSPDPLPPWLWLWTSLLPSQGLALSCICQQHTTCSASTQQTHHWSCVLHDPHRPAMGSGTKWMLHLWAWVAEDQPWSSKHTCCSTVGEHISGFIWRVQIHSRLQEFKTSEGCNESKWRTDHADTFSPLWFCRSSLEEHSTPVFLKHAPWTCFHLHGLHQP